MTPKIEREGDVLDLLRILASCFVLLAHFFFDNTVLHLPHFERTYFATDFFLILSGYVLAVAYGDRLSRQQIGWSGFFLRRLMRIWPAHAAVLFAFVLSRGAAEVMGVSLHQEPTFSALIAQLALVQSWGLLGDDIWFQWNYPTWTLSALVLCYAVFPLIWRAAGRADRVLSGVAALGVLVVSDALTRTISPYVLANIPQHHGVYRGLPLFAAGVLISRFAGVLKDQPRTSNALFAVSAAAIGVILLLPGNDSTALLALIAMLGVTAASANMDVRFPSWVASGAQLSFALYLTHELTSRYCFSILSRLDATATRGIGAWIGFAGAFIAALFAAWLLDRFFDAPVQRYLRQRYGQLWPRKDCPT